MTEFEPIKALPLPYNADDKIFQVTDDMGNIVGEPYSWNDCTKMIENMSGIDEELLGECDE